MTEVIREENPFGINGLITHGDMGLDARENVFGGLRTTKTQTSLRICAVGSAPLLLVFGKYHIKSY